MYQFLLTDSNYTTLFVMAVIVALMIVGIWIMNAKDSNNTIGGKILLTIVTGISFLALVGAGYGFTQELTAKQVHPKDVYTITKTGKLITFDEKLDNWKLKNKVTTQIVGETKNQYQVEVNGNFYNVSKSDVE